MAPNAAASHAKAAPVAAEPAPAKTLSLPVLVSSPVDVGRLVRELEMIDETLLQLGLRQPGS